MEKISSLSYVDLQNVDSFHYTTSKNHIPYYTVERKFWNGRQTLSALVKSLQSSHGFNLVNSLYCTFFLFRKIQWRLEGVRQTIPSMSNR